MAGNRRAYESAMRRAAGFVERKRWSRAIEEYHKALAEFPQDVAALTGLGLAYAETQQLEKALDAYKRAANLSPDNPEVIQRVGHILRRMARWSEAARAYVLAADAFLRLRDVEQAIGMWRQAVILDPTNLDAHQNLIKVYRDRGELRRAARHHLIVARVMARQGKTGEAMEHCNQALELDPRNVEAQEILDALKRGEPLPDGPTARLQPDAEGKRTLDSFVVFEDIEIESAALLGEERRTSPADVVRERALAAMAEALFAESEDPRDMQINLLLAQAADLHARGLVDKAIDAYQSALRLGVDTPALHFNLGLLYQEKGDYPRALEHLERVLSEPDYTLGAHFALGECYYSWGKIPESLRHLFAVLKIIDTQTSPEGRVAELNAEYERLQQRYLRQDGSEDGRLVARSLLTFLSSRGWGQRVVEARRQLDSLAGGALVMTLAEGLADPEASLAIDSMKQIQNYLQQDMVFTALEECFWAIQHAPYYLPLHLRMVDILIGEGRLEEAVQKYVTVAETYRVRGDLWRAITIYKRALEVAPMNVEVRQKVIALLAENGMIDQVIEQYIALADTYYQLAQVDQAVATYDEALRYAPRGSPERHWEANILHRVADIQMQQLKWREAVSIYRRIKRIEPGDERARLNLVDLYFKLGQRDQALRELDELIEVHKSQRRPRKALAALQELVRSRPEEIALHIRLAKMYLDLRMKEEAIAELDTIGEMQLQAGMTQEAIRTIQAIIRLGPANVEGYRQLLAQLKSQ